MEKKRIAIKETQVIGDNETQKRVIEKETVRQIKETIPKIIKEAISSLGSEKLWREGKEMTGYDFELSKIPIHLIMNYKGTLENPEGDYYASTAVHEGWDIYVDYQPEETIERRLFHEILEIHYRKLGYDSHEAHQVTLSEENRVFGEREAYDTNGNRT